MLGQLLFIVSFASFGVGMFIFYIFYFLIFAVIVGTVIKSIVKGVKSAKQKLDADDIFMSVDETDKSTTNAQPEYVACEYCGFVNSFDSKKCTCCGAPIKTKNV